MKLIKPLLLFLCVTVFCIQCTKSGQAGARSVGRPTSGTNPSDSLDIQTVIFISRSVQAGAANTFTISAITRNILDSGEVHGYIRTAGTLGVWHSLPFIVDNGNISIYTVSVGSLTVFSTHNENIGGDFKFEIIGKQ